MEALTQVAAARQPVKDAVYQYWLDKRKQLGKPLLRRLQAPTNSSDTNPHSCFRSGPVLPKLHHAFLAVFLPLQVIPTRLLHLMLLDTQSNTAVGLCIAVSISSLPLQVIPTRLLRLMLLDMQSNTAVGLCIAVSTSSLCLNYRPREKINRPILRNRRRGNDIDSLQKLQTIRQNQMDAIKVVQFLIKRERKKRDITVCLANALVNGLLLDLLVWADVF